MFFEEDREYKMVAPDVDELLRYFDRLRLSPTPSTPALFAAAEKLCNIMEPLAPLTTNNEARAIWLRIPRGTSADYDSFEDMKNWGEVETYEEYKACWLKDYPEESCWYELVTVKIL